MDTAQKNLENLLSKSTFESPYDDEVYKDLENIERFEEYRKLTLAQEERLERSCKISYMWHLGLSIKEQEERILWWLFCWIRNCENGFRVLIDEETS